MFARHCRPLRGGCVAMVFNLLRLIDAILAYLGGLCVGWYG